MKILSCLACESTRLLPVLSFPQIPLTDKYSNDLQVSLSLRRYPLDAYLCQACTHVQLGYQVDPVESYSEYIYQSVITPGLSDQFTSYASDLLSALRSNSSADSLDILDVGSNDGSFMQSLKHFGMSAFGVEPARHLSEICNKSSLPTINCFFDESISNSFIEEGFPLKYDAITFNNVLANIPSPFTALCTAKRLLKDSTSLISIQTGYHPVQFSRGLFDYIYHEHYSYFSLRSMRALAARAGLIVSGFKRLDLRGGSARFYLSSLESKDLDSEHERFDCLTDFKSLNVLISTSAAQLRNNLLEYKKDGLTVVGYGASHSTGTLIHSFQLISLLDLVVDDNSLKHGKYVPGTSLKVYPPTINLMNNAIVVVLAWQYYDLISSKLRKLGFKGPILRPVLP